MLRIALAFGLMCGALAACGGGDEQSEAVPSAPGVVTAQPSEEMCQAIGAKMVDALAQNEVAEFLAPLPDEAATIRYFNIASPNRAEARGQEAPTADDIAAEIERDIAMRQRLFTELFNDVLTDDRADWTAPTLEWRDTQFQEDQYAPGIEMIRLVGIIKPGNKVDYRMVLKCRAEGAEHTALTIKIE